jgi:hypothetical protein
MAATLIMGENRTLTLDLRDTSGAALIVAGWSLELRIGDPQVKVVKPLVADGVVTGRVSCVFGPEDLNAVGVGLLRASVWRTDVGLVTLVALFDVDVRRV